MSKKCGFHSGTLTCQDAKIQGDLYVQDDIVFSDVSAGTLSVTGGIDFSSISGTTAPNLILGGYGRVTTGSAGGSALSLDASYTYGEAIELRYDVSSWSGLGNSFNGMYFRTSTSTGNASGELHSMYIYGVSNITSGTTGMSLINPLYVEMLIKAGTGNKTFATCKAIEANISIENPTSGTLTFTNNVYALEAKVQTGSGIADYTKFCGIKIGGRNDGVAKVYGNALDIANPEATVCTWTNGISISTTCATGINFSGTFTGNGIDFSSCTYVPTGADGPCLIRAGSYTTPITNSATAQSGLIRLYMETTADGSSYDRALFTCLKTTGTKGIIPISGLAEVHEDATGPANVKGCEFVVQLFDTGSNIPASGLMFGGWFKVTAIDGATINATAKVAPIWLDNQLYGVNASSCLEYSIWNTTGGTTPLAFIGFGTTSSGHDNFLYFDSTYAIGTGMIGSGDKDGGTADAYLKVSINGTAYAIQMYQV